MQKGNALPHIFYKKVKARTAFAVQASYLLQIESLVETINTSTGVNQLLLAGVERVALRADFNSDVLLSGTGRKDVATSATDRCLFVIGMDTFLHFVHLFHIS